MRTRTKWIPHEAETAPQSYLQELERAVEADRHAHAKRPLKPKAKGDSDDPPNRNIKQSKTDVDSGYLTREGKPQGFFYLDHRTVDGKHSIITDTHVTLGNVHDRSLSGTFRSSV